MSSRRRACSQLLLSTLSLVHPLDRLLPGTSSTVRQLLMLQLSIALLILQLGALRHQCDAASCTVAPNDRHFATTWAKQPGRGCWAHTLTRTEYTSLHDAQTECEQSPACSGVHDLSCRGIFFYLCDAVHPIANLTDGGDFGAPPCVYAKPNTMYTKTNSGLNRSGTIDGRWCSKWCVPYNCPDIPPIVFTSRNNPPTGPCQ